MGEDTDEADEDSFEDRQTEDWQPTSISSSSDAIKSDTTKKHVSFGRVSLYEFFQCSEEINYKAPNNSEHTYHKTDAEFEREQAFFQEYYKWPPKSTTV